MRDDGKDEIERKTENVKVRKKKGEKERNVNK